MRTTALVFAITCCAFAGLAATHEARDDQSTATFPRREEVTCDPDRSESQCEVDHYLRQDLNAAGIHFTPGVEPKQVAITNALKTLHLANAVAVVGGVVDVVDQTRVPTTVVIVVHDKNSARVISILDAKGFQLLDRRITATPAVRGNLTTTSDLDAS